MYELIGNSSYNLRAYKRTEPISLSLLACTVNCIFNISSLSNIHQQWYNIMRRLPPLSSCFLPWHVCYLFVISCDKNGHIKKNSQTKNIDIFNVVIGTKSISIESNIYGGFFYFIFFWDSTVDKDACLQF